MKKLILLTGLTAAFSVQAADLKNVDEKVSYTLGSDLAKNFEKQGVNIDIDALVLGMQDVFNKQPLKLTEQQMQQAVIEVKKNLVEKQKQAQAEKAMANAKAGDAFLSQNKTKEGVKVLTSGLQYKVLTEGEGASPSESDTITANYEGRLIDGTVFDSSYQRNKPIEFKMADVIKGWGEALKIMKPGARWEIYVPPSLGYGSKGAGNVIGPNETLIFTIELVKYDKSA